MSNKPITNWTCGARIVISFIFLYPLLTSQAVALTDEEKMKAVEEMFSSPYTEEMYYRTDRLLLTATGSLQPLYRAPAVATVITAEDIKRIGATTLDEALETVPGLHVSPSSVNTLMDSVYSIRGIHTGINPQVLMLMNGVPITNLYTGSRPLTFNLPIADISRVEVIRGPGSAVHGADAFAGVINIITKDAQEIDGVEVGGRAGSFDFYNPWFQYGATLMGWDVAVSFEYQKTNGDSDRIIDADLQSSIDTIFGTNASLAPGPLDTKQKILNTHLELAKNNLSFRFWSWLQDDAGGGAGVTQVLSNQNSVDANVILADLTYRNTDIFRDLDMSVRLSHLYIDQDSFVQLFPAGSKLPIGSDGNINFVSPAGIVTFTDGVFGNPVQTDYQTAIDLTALYSGFNQNLWRFGTGFKYLEEETAEKKNFGPGILDGASLPATVDGTLTDVTNTPFVFMENQIRRLLYFSLQDEWSFATNWDLTAGVRYDHYSDFGDTVNPRLALVWETRPDLTIKALYGEAFRPPSFTELFAQNNPANKGNSNLSPETIKTYELGFDYQPRKNLRLLLNLFTYDIKDLIEIVPDPAGGTSTAQNAKNQKGHGFETEADWQVTDDFRLYSNFAYQHSKDTDTDEIVPDAPALQFYLNPHWTFLTNWSLDGQLFWIGDRKRANDDPRPDIKNYTKVNLTLRRKNIAQHWDVALSVRNLFEKDIREPSPEAIPNDYPMEGRSFYGELVYTY